MGWLFFYKSIGLILMVLILGCNARQDKHSVESNPVIDETMQFIKAKCFTCHRIQDEEGQLAPSFVQISKTYKKDHADRESFVNAITLFLKNPNTSSIKLKDAKALYGPMAPISLTPTQMEQISQFLFDSL